MYQQLCIMAYVLNFRFGQCGRRPDVMMENCLVYELELNGELNSNNQFP